MLAKLSPLRRARVVTGGFHLEIGPEGATTELACRQLISSAGLDARSCARRIEETGGGACAQGLVCEGELLHPEWTVPPSVS